MELTVDQAIGLIRSEEAKLADVNNRINQSVALLSELKIAKATLSNLPEKESETLIPIGGGILLPSKASSRVKVMINVGAGAVVEKSIPDAIKMLDEKIALVDKNIKQLSDLASKLKTNIDTLKSKVDEVIKSRQGPTVVG
jgi:prefoldin alpha subunit